MNIAGYIDHTILKPTTTIAAIEQLCGEAIQYQFAAVCIPPLFVKKAKELTAGSPVKVATVIGREKSKVLAHPYQYRKTPW